MPLVYAARLLRRLRRDAGASTPSRHFATFAAPDRRPFDCWRFCHLPYPGAADATMCYMLMLMNHQRFAVSGSKA